VKAGEGVKGRGNKKPETAKKSDGCHDEEAFAVTRFLHFVRDTTIGGLGDAFGAEWVSGAVTAKTFTS